MDILEIIPSIALLPSAKIMFRQGHLDINRESGADAPAQCFNLCPKKVNWNLSLDRNEK